MVTPRWSERALTVSEVTRRLQSAVEPRFRGVEVRGEIVGARPSSAGHSYFTLRDAGARIPCVFWRTALARHPGRVEDGMQVVVRGDLQVYPAGGRYQLVVQRLAEIGLGELLARLDELKRKLHAEGLFDEANKRPLPLAPRRVGLVTALTGAALHDFVVTARRRWAVPIVLCACRVQGDMAARSIAGAIRVLARRPRVDVIVVTRGGGSALDLLPFSEERVVRAVAGCPVPVVTAIGHEIDVSLADLAADRRAATPTAAAELVVPSGVELSGRLGRLEERLVRVAERRTAEARQRLDEDQRRVRLGLGRRLQRARGALDAGRARLAALHPRARLLVWRERRAAAERRLRAAIRSRLLGQRQRVAMAAERLELRSPMAGLDRGWALVRRHSGSIVRRVADVTVDEELSIQMRDGTFVARVVATTATATQPQPREDS